MTIFKRILDHGVLDIYTTKCNVTHKLVRFFVRQTIAPNQWAICVF